MKKILILVKLLLICVFVLSSCVRSYSLFYDYDKLVLNLVRAEIIYMEDDLAFFVVHSYVDVEDIVYEFRKELSLDETRRLLIALSEIEFTYEILWAPVSVSNEFNMQGYAIKLYYTLECELSYSREPFIIIARTGDYRYGKPRLNQARAGRVSTYDEWNALISEFYLVY